MASSSIDNAHWALAAQAAYGFFDQTGTPEQALTQKGKADFTSSESERFLGALRDPNAQTSQGFELRHHQANDSTGFSATVFFDRSSNKYVLGIRGTEEFSDLAEDFLRVGVQGFAGDQLVSLYRYYRKLTTPAGQSVRYSDSEVSTLQSIRLGVFVNPASLVFSALRTAALRSQLALDQGISPLTGSGPSVLPAGAPLIVTGHSLGGHLALLFGRFFPSVAEHVYTYDAPGIGRQGEYVLRALGIPQLPSSQVTNVAAVMGNEAISRIWSKPGENIGIATEPGSLRYQHSIVPLTDALALYGAFGTLSPGLSANAAAVSGIISGSSPFPENSLEVVVDHLGKLLKTGSAPVLIASSLADLDERDDYYQKLYKVLDSREPGRDYRIESMVGKTANEIASLAATDISVHFALKELTPFAAGGADFSSFGGDFSGAWISSRAELLAAELKGNSVDRAFGLSGSADNLLFVDVESGARYSMLDSIQGNLAGQIGVLAERSRLQDFLRDVPYGRKVVFGSDSMAQGDDIVGLSGGDRLFGGAGADSLDGGLGDDYLEGGSGDDTLIGGGGADTLEGGVGSDRLEGGPGDDTYIFDAELDSDTIVDRDGIVYAGAVQLTGGSSGQGGNYVSGDGRFRYALAGGTLVVNGALRIEGFQNGDLGIRLTDAPEHGAPSLGAAETVLLGDSVYVPFPIESELAIPRSSYDPYGNPLPETRTGADPDRVDTFEDFQGTPGNTWFLVGGGDDVIQDLLGGDDRIVLGSGDDAGWGGTGNDVVEGGPGRDLVAGGRGDDFLYAGTADNLEADLDDQATGSRTDGGDLLSGGDGDDTIYGDAEANLIEGGAGRDRIFGGAGDDWIGADIAELSKNERYQIHPINNDWINRVVDVLWTYSPLPTYSLQAAGYFGAAAVAKIGGTYLDPLYLDGSIGDADEINAGAGNDTIVAGGGDDLVFGGAGDDYIDAGTGADTIFGGEGRDYVLAWRDAVGDYIDAGDGDDVVSGGGGDDVLIGGTGNDRIFSGGGNDLLLGGAGNDLLSSVSGGDVLDGGPGDDRLIIAAQPDQVSTIRMGFGSGADLVETRTGGVIVEMIGEVAPQDVEVASVNRLIPAEDGEAGGFETLRGIEFAIGTSGDSLFLVDPPPGWSQPVLRVGFADGTVWDEAYIQSRLASRDAPDGPVDSGNDTYLYAGGDGFDLVEDVEQAPGNIDVLRFAGGIAAGDVSVFATCSDYVLSAGAGGVRLLGGRTPEGAIERIEFSDGTLWSPADLEARAEVLPDNRAPLMPSSFGSISIDPGKPMEITLPTGAISDPDRFDSISVYAVSADGEKLPDWLHFDASSLTLTGTPADADAGPHELLLIAADSSGAAATASLTIAVGGGEAPTGQAPSAPAAAPTASVPAATPTAEKTIAVDAPLAQQVAAPARPAALFSTEAPATRPAGDLPRVGVPVDPFFRDMQQRFDVLLQTGRTNLGERYAEAVREFEERRQQREEPPPPPPPTDEEVEAWNSAMHDWHDRNPGFAQTELGSNDGAWSMGWGLPGPGDRLLDGGPLAAGAPGLANPNALPRLGGSASSPALAEGLRDLR